MTPPADELDAALGEALEPVNDAWQDPAVGGGLGDQVFPAFGAALEFGGVADAGTGEDLVLEHGEIVGEEERALRTMAAYIDLNPVRAGMVADPADYRWSGYAEAMAGKARSRRGLVRIIGQMAWPRESAAESMEDQKAGTRRGAGRNTRGRVCSPWGSDVFPAMVERRALVFYRAIPGGQGRKREDGTVVRRGLSEKVREKLTTAHERRLAAEVLTRRVQHFHQRRHYWRVGVY